MNRLLARLVIVAALVGLSRQVAAGPLVFETYPTARIKEADRIMPTLLGALASMRYVAKVDDVRRVLGPQVPLPGSESDETTQKFTKTLSDATNAWIKQPVSEQLLPPLVKAVDAAEHNPALLVGNRLRRDVFKDILFDLSLAYQRDGQLEKSRDVLAELIRSFPADVITQQERGPEAEQYYRTTRAELDKLGRGTLTVSVSDPNVSLYVDEVIRQSGVKIPDLSPGPYRVVAIDPSGQARRYVVHVLKNQDSILNVDWDAHSALTVTPSSVAFVFQTETAYAKRVDIARRFVRSVTGESSMVLVGLTKTAGKLEAVAGLYGVASGRTLRSASVELVGHGDDERLHALASFIVHGTENPDVTVIKVFDPADVARGTPVDEPVSSASTSPALTTNAASDVAVSPIEIHPYRAYIATGAALVGIGAGLGLVLANDNGFCIGASACPGTRGPGYVIGGAGVIAGALAVYFWANDQRSDDKSTIPTMSVLPARGGGFASASWSF